MSTFWGVLLILVAIVAGLVLIASRKPDSFRFERRARIGAPPEAVFAQINDLIAWQAWSPWAKKDPAAKAFFGPITAGEGANFRWDGCRDVGKGQMTITRSVPSERVEFSLEFEKPFKATNIAEFDLRPVEGGTEVIWAIHGAQPLMSKIMCLFMDMDKMVGRDFEAGLASLKAIAEAKPTA